MHNGLHRVAVVRGRKGGNQSYVALRLAVQNLSVALNALSVLNGFPPTHASLNVALNALSVLNGSSSPRP